MLETIDIGNTCVESADMKHRIISNNVDNLLESNTLINSWSNSISFPLKWIHFMCIITFTEDTAKSNMTMDDTS